MKYVIWVIAFVTYALVFTGIFKLAAGFTKGIEVEMNVKRVVYGEVVERRQMVEFNEIPAIKWIFGMSGLFITVGGGFVTGNYLSKAWTGEDETGKLTKKERVIWAGIFTVFFFAFSFTFKVHTIEEAFGTSGWLFMMLTCVSSYILSTLLCALLRKTVSKTASADSGVAS